MELKSTPAQLRARKNYTEKNKGRARLPCGYLDDETARKLEELAAVKGSKMAAINSAIALLYQQETEVKNS